LSLFSTGMRTAPSTASILPSNPTACAVSNMAYVRWRKVATARTKDTTFQIVQIVVLGIVTEEGVRSVTPAPYFSVFAVDEISI
jgi:hypothetical protein